MKKTLNLEELNIKSFVTVPKANMVQGGAAASNTPYCYTNRGTACQ